MDSHEFRLFGKAAVDFIAEYLETIRSREVLPSVEPGYLQHLVPSTAPEEPQNWKEILEDFERVVMPGITHWQSPHFHAYYPSANSYPTIVGELLSAGLGIVGFSWIASPACTELEVVMMDWLGKLINLPEPFLNCADGPGGGVIQGSASEATLVCLLAAKEKKLRGVLSEHPDWDEAQVKGNMVAYTSEHSNSSVEKAGLLGSMKMRLLETDDKCSLRGDTLLRAFKEDIAAGRIPTYVCATLGTTGTCSFDNMEELGAVCQQLGVWLHVDAAYAGTAFICPEYQYLMTGVELADSFCFNPHKWMLVNYDCSAMWVKDAGLLIDAFNVDRIYLEHQKQGVAAALDYRHWQIPLGRRFRSLKLWITLKAYGVKGIQSHIRKQVKLAEDFEARVKNDDRFEVPCERSMGLVCFRLKGPNELSKNLLDRITANKQIYLIAGSVRDKIVLRFAVCSRMCEASDIDFALEEITSQADAVLAKKTNGTKMEVLDGRDKKKCCFLNGAKVVNAGRFEYHEG